MTINKFDKAGMLLEAIGTIDELMAVLTVAEVTEVMDDLKAIMSELAVGKKVKNLEVGIRKLEKEADDGEGFVDFKTEKGKRINWARTVARRAERRVVVLSKRQKIDDKILVYMNRLSSYLFSLGRKEERK